MTPLHRAWTIRRATQVGIVTGVAAFALAGLRPTLPESATLPYALLLAVTALCGVSILLITARDMRIRGTSHLMRPIRGVDLAVGAVLFLPAAYALWPVWPDLGL